MTRRGLVVLSGMVMLVSSVSGNTASPVTQITTFNKLTDWVSASSPNVAITHASNGFIRISATPDEKNPKQIIQIQSTVARPLPESAQRAGIWICIEEPMPIAKANLLFEDAQGVAFEYTLPAPESWVTGWQYIDTFPFDANERGQMHPLVGRAPAHPGALPKKPLAFRGLRLESTATLKGSWLLKSVEADSYTLGMPTYHWALNRPRERYWMTSTLQRSGEKPYVPLGWVLPSGGDVDLFWELTAGYQGQTVQRGHMQVNLAPGDVEGQARRIELGDLPQGNYQFRVSSVLRDLREAAPEGWKRLIWRANGSAEWDSQVAGEGKRSFQCRKVDGEGYAGWRTIVRLPQPGTYQFRVMARGDGSPEARVTAFDRNMQNVMKTVSIKFKNSSEWSTQLMTVEMPPEADRVQVDMLATKAGQAWFDAVSLKNAEHEILKAGDAETAQVLTQLVMPLTVIASTKEPLQSQAPELIVSAGEKMSVPLPDWSERKGEKTWTILDHADQKVGEGIISGAKLEWAPPTPGAYTMIMVLRDGKLEMDRKVLKLGCRTPMQSLGQNTFTARDKVLTEKDLFGPGKNYFTWSVYENHPDEPEYFEQFHTWVQDGRKAGFELFRIRIDWNWIEPLPGVYDFSAIDRLLQDVASQGGKAILEVRFEAPEWLDIAPQLDSYGRADIWRPGKVGRIPSIWTPGMLDAIRKFTQATVIRYRNSEDVAGYHFWGLPGSLDWTNLDRPWLGKRVDYSPAALAAFKKWSNGADTTIPAPSSNWDEPDLSAGWRDWVEFRRYSLETYLIDNVVKPLRELDDKRSVVCYFGLDFASPRLAESARTLNWRRHTGGCELYYQTQVHAMRAVMDSGKSWPQEVHLMTPIPGGLEQATFQISTAGGEGLHWNYYWRSTIRVGQWTPDQEQALQEWQTLWRPMWQELRDTTPAQQTDMGVLTTWSTMQYLVRSFFALRQDDYTTRIAASIYRDHLWPTWFSENAKLDFLPQLKLVVIPPSGAQVLPSETAEAIAAYVKQGGNVVMFPESAKWIIEERGKPYGLLARMACPSLPKQPEQAASMEVGNSGLPTGTTPATQMVEMHDPAFVGLGKIEFRNPYRLAAKANWEVLGTFADGQPAVVRWNAGKGQVILFAGTPEWEKTPGLMAKLYAWAKGNRTIFVDQPSVLANELVKGQDYYVILHRLPDSFRPHPPELVRETLRKQPSISTRWQIHGLPEQKWRIADMTAPEEPAKIVSTSELAKGLSINMYLAQTRVFKITPAGK